MKFFCPDCEGKLEAEREWLGQSVACPHCGTDIVVAEPEARSLPYQSLPEVVHSNPPTGANLPEAQSSSQLGRRLSSAAGDLCHQVVALIRGYHRLVKRLVVNLPLPKACQRNEQFLKAVSISTFVGFLLMVSAILFEVGAAKSSSSRMSDNLSDKDLKEILAQAVEVKMTALEIASLEAGYSTPYSGWVKVLHPNGQPALLAYCEDRVVDGVLTEWHENGQKKLEYHYQNGQHVGTETYWHPNGQKSGEGHYKNGKMEGLFVGWYDSGQKECEQNYVNGELHGQTVRWHENGQKSYQTFYKKGEVDSVSYRWDENGRLQSAW